MDEPAAVQLISPQQSMVCVVVGDWQRRQFLIDSLTGLGCEVAAFQDIASAKAADIAENCVLITAEHLPDGYFDELTQKLAQNRKPLPTIVTAVDGDINSAVSAFQHGAIDYLTEPYSSFDICNTVKRAIRKHY